MHAHAGIKADEGQSEIMERITDAESLKDAVRAAENGDGKAQKELAGIAGRELERIGMESLDSLAAEENSWALLLIGRAYEESREIDGDFGTAITAYEDSAAKGNPYAMAALARLYEKGDGRTKSLYNAYLLHKKAASEGLSSSVEWLKMHGEDAEELGRIIDGSEKGDADSRYRLALEYEKGERIERSATKALALMTTAASQGHEEVALHAADMFLEGLGNPAFRGIGICMLATLAENGCEKAQKKIRSMTPFDLSECDGEDLRRLASKGSSWAEAIVSMIDGEEPDEHFS